jgi:hypothetical protein
VQEVIWQPVYDSDFIPADTAEVPGRRGPKFDGPPFKASGPSWEQTDVRTWRCGTSEKTDLVWADDQLPLDDFNAYNVYRTSKDELDPVSDIRVSAAIRPENADLLRTVLRLDARDHRFEFEVQAGVAAITMRNAAGVDVARAEGEFEWGPGSLLDVVFSHVDQTLSIEIGGVEAVRLAYEWNPLQRLDAVYTDFDMDSYRRGPRSLRIRRPRLSWSFEGSPFEMTRIRVERDLHYKTGVLDSRQQVASNGPYISGMLYATDPLEPAVLGPDQFLMLGDNSGASRDSRYWGRPHPLSVLTTEDDAPFLVPRDMLVGKAWCVYFPAPTAFAGSGPRYMPDFGRLRFIR